MKYLTLLLLTSSLNTFAGQPFVTVGLGYTVHSNNSYEWEVAEKTSSDKKGKIIGEYTQSVVEENLTMYHVDAGVRTKYWDLGVSYHDSLGSSGDYSPHKLEVFADLVKRGLLEYKLGVGYVLDQDQIKLDLTSDVYEFHKPVGHGLSSNSDKLSARIRISKTFDKHYEIGILHNSFWFVGHPWNSRFENHNTQVFIAMKFL